MTVNAGNRSRIAASFLGVLLFEGDLTCIPHVKKNHKFSGDSLEEWIETGICKIDSFEFGMKLKPRHPARRSGRFQRASPDRPDEMSQMELNQAS